jgi:hypothetical protein
MKRPWVVLAASLALVLAACEGPVGPPGPGTRVVLDGTTDEFGDGLISLPSAAGSLASPPVISCYVSETGSLWFVVAVDSTQEGLITACLLGQNEDGTLFVAVFGAPASWLFRAVVVY